MDKSLRRALVVLIWAFIVLYFVVPLILFIFLFIYNYFIIH